MIYIKETPFIYTIIHAYTPACTHTHVHTHTHIGTPKAQEMIISSISENGGRGIEGRTKNGSLVECPFKNNEIPLALPTLYSQVYLPPATLAET